jgi:hypothetical protein
MKHKLIQMLPTRLYLELRWWDYKLNRSKSFKNTQRHRVTHSNEYGSYEPFDKNKAIFVHIPKCAGISLNKTLFNSVGGGHTTLDQYIHVFEPKNFQEYFKFTFVRNPWDRFISLWIKFKEEPKLQEQFNGLFELHIDTDFKEPQEVLRYLLLAHRKGIMMPRWFKPQYEYIHDENLRVLTNYVGTYEKFQFCFDFLCERIDVPHKTLPWGGEEHRRHNKEKKHYTDYYDPVMINAVAEIYHNDIRTWKYEF